MKQALGLGDSGGFPYQLAPLGAKESVLIPAVPLEDKAPSLKSIFNAETEIYIALIVVSILCMSNERISLSTFSVHYNLCHF